MARTVHAVDVEIEGHLDPSLAKAVGLTDAQLKRLTSAAATFNSVTAKMGAEAPRQFQVAADRINSAMRSVESGSNRMSRHLGENFKKAAEQARESGERITKSLAGAFDKITEKAMHLTGIGGLVGTVGAAFAGEEFVRGAFEVRAERGVLQNQLRTISESTGHPELATQIDTLIRNMEGQTTPIRYEPLLETANRLIAAAPERFKTSDQMKAMLGKLADVSTTPESFALVSQAFSRILAEGKVDAQHLNEMAIDANLPFRKAMADALKVNPEQLTEMLKKHKLTGTQQIDALIKSFDILTGPGGPAYKHSEAQLQGLAGIQSKFLGHWRDFQESFGKQLENFLQPISDKVFSILTPATLTHAFDSWTGAVKKFSTDFAESLGAMFKALQGGQAAEQLRGIGQALSQITAAFAGTKGAKDTWDPFGNKVISAAQQRGVQWADDITKVLGTIRSTVQFIAEHFNTIKTSLEVLLGGMLVSKGYEIGKGILSPVAGLAKLFSKISAPLVNVAGEVVNVGGAKIPGGPADTVKKLISKIPIWSLPVAAVGGGIYAGLEAEKYSREHAPEMIAANKARAEHAKAVGESQYKASAFPDSAAMRDYIAKHEAAANATKNLGDKASTSSTSISSLGTSAVSAATALGNVALAIGQLASKIAGISIPTAPGLNVPPPTIAKPHALGGLFTRPHLGLIAEKGPELLTPLTGPRAGFGMGGHSLTIHSNPVIQVGAGADIGNIKEALEEHARTIAAEVRRIIEIDLERDAVV